MFGLVCLPNALALNTPSVTTEALLERAIKSEVRDFVSGRRDLLKAIQRGMTLDEAMKRGVGYFDVPNVRRMAHLGLARGGRLHSLVVSLGLADPFGDSSLNGGYLLLRHSQLAGLRSAVEQSRDGGTVSAANPPLSSEEGFLKALLGAIEDALDDGSDLALEWRRSLVGVGIACSGLKVDVVERALQNKDPQIVVELARSRFRTDLEEKVRAPLRGEHFCVVSTTFLLTATSEKKQFEEPRDEIAFRLLVEAAGVRFDPTRRGNDNHRLVPLSPNEVDALWAACERASRRELDLAELARAVGFAWSPPDWEDLVGAEGRVRFAIEEEVGPEVAAFLKKKPAKGKTLYLAACIGGELVDRPMTAPAGPL